MIDLSKMWLGILQGYTQTGPKFLPDRSQNLVFGVWGCFLAGSILERAVCVCVCVLTTQLCPILCDPTRQAPPSMGFSKQENWSGLPFPSPGASSQPRDGTRVSRIVGRLYHLSNQGSQKLSLARKHHENNIVASEGTSHPINISVAKHEYSC